MKMETLSMNSTDIVGYTHNGEAYCTNCIPAIDDSPIFADSEWDSFPTCDNCREEITSINLTDKGKEWLVFERGTDTGFMKGEVTENILWYEINDGEELYPLDVLSEKEIREYLARNYPVRIILGIGARLSAPGYTDCTDWTIFENYQEALEYLYQEIIGEYE